MFVFGIAPDNYLCVSSGLLMSSDVSHVCDDSCITFSGHHLTACSRSHPAFDVASCDAILYSMRLCDTRPSKWDGTIQFSIHGVTSSYEITNDCRSHQTWKFQQLCRTFKGAGLAPCALWHIGCYPIRSLMFKLDARAKSYHDVLHSTVLHCVTWIMLSLALNPCHGCPHWWLAPKTWVPFQSFIRFRVHPGSPKHCPSTPQAARGQDINLELTRTGSGI